MLPYDGNISKSAITNKCYKIADDNITNYLKAICI